MLIGFGMMILGYGIFASTQSRQGDPKPVYIMLVGTLVMFVAVLQ